MKHSLPVVALLLSATACTNPQLESIRRGDTPIQVAVSLPASAEDRGAKEALFAQALRDQIGTRAKVLPAQAELPPGAATLAVTVTYLDSVPGREAVGAAAQGDAFGVAHGLGAKKTFGGALGEGVVTGAAVGLFTYGGASMRESYHTKRLGYEPRHATCRVELVQAGSAPKCVLQTSAWEVVKAMKPLPEAQANNPQAILQEEARALAQVVSEKLK